MQVCDVPVFELGFSLEVGDNVEVAFGVAEEFGVGGVVDEGGVFGVENVVELRLIGNGCVVNV